MTKRPKDAQRSRVLTAENLMRQRYAVVQPSALLPNAEALVRSDWYRSAVQAAGNTNIKEVHAHFNTYHQCTPNWSYGKLTLRMGAGKSTVLDVAHALAHYITPPNTQLHGAEFAKNYLDVLERLGGGRSHRQEFRALFIGQKVKYRTWSPEAKERARKRAEEKGTPFTRRATEEQQQQIIDMMRELSRPNRTGGTEDEHD